MAENANLSKPIHLPAQFSNFQSAFHEAFEARIDFTSHAAYPGGYYIAGNTNGNSISAERSLQRCAAVQVAIPLLCLTGMGYILVDYAFISGVFAAAGTSNQGENFSSTSLIVFLFGLNPALDALSVFVLLPPYRR